ncbi:MAG TPA: serine/threonine-protein kinase [Polyangiaceae bacterium]|nr:serine/threonine-protein kinase [Polyangiaceae bacterium]
MSELTAGSRLDHYELEELLARSGMASIFKAVDVDTGRPVALKVPHLHLEGDIVFSERFRREEQIGQRLDHPGIIKVFAPKGKRSRTYIAMELVEGRSLRALLGKKPLPPERAVELTLELGEALAYLHSNGVVHRDLKPENVLITPEGHAKLLDFGIALDESARRLTWTGLSSTVGTPDYMAPEQAKGRRGDVRTDIYALGTLLYEMLTGELPFVGGSAEAILRAKGSEDPRPPRGIVPELDPMLEEIALHALEREPRDRYQRMADLLDDLKHPDQVVPRDRSEILARRRRFFGIPRERLLPVFLGVIVILLGSLTWLSHRRSGAPAGSSLSPASGHGNELR